MRLECGAALGAMTGVDPNDPATVDQAGNAFANYTVFLNAHALQGARIGVWRESSFEVGGVPVNEDVSAIMDNTIAALEAAGAIIVDPANVTFGAWAGAEYPKTLQDLIDFNNNNPDLESGAPASNWNSLLFDFAQATGGRDAACAAQRAIATPGARAAIDDLMAACRPASVRSMSPLLSTTIHPWLL